jgi:hypothetical protein
MNLSFLTQLQIETLDHIDSRTLAKTFGKLPLLERVCVHRFVSRFFLEALVNKTKAAEKSKTAYYDISFPNLRFIHLEGTDFFMTHPTKWIDTLLDCLMERCERNAEVQTLRLDDFSCLSSDDIKRLEEIVVDVIWDEVEQAISEEDSEGEREYDSDGNIIDEDYDDYDYSSYDDFPGGMW